MHKNMLQKQIKCRYEDRNESNEPIETEDLTKNNLEHGVKNINDRHEDEEDVRKNELASTEERTDNNMGENDSIIHQKTKEPKKKILEYDENLNYRLEKEDGRLGENEKLTEKNLALDDIDDSRIDESIPYLHLKVYAHKSHDRAVQPSPYPPKRHLQTGKTKHAKVALEKPKIKGLNQDRTAVNILINAEQLKTMNKCMVNDTLKVPSYLILTPTSTTNHQDPKELCHSSANYCPVENNYQPIQPVSSATKKNNRKDNNEVHILNPHQLSKIIDLLETLPESVIIITKPGKKEKHTEVVSAKQSESETLKTSGENTFKQEGPIQVVSNHCSTQQKGGNDRCDTREELGMTPGKYTPYDEAFGTTCGKEIMCEKSTGKGTRKQKFQDNMADSGTMDCPFPTLCSAYQSLFNKTMEKLQEKSWQNQRGLTEEQKQIYFGKIPSLMDQYTVS
uniref:Uncharacterized protein n=1 Tax=Cacopsylla melanoneura TaxID=428564 RepID=A0A8D9BBM4_9HEMI